jgi:hypothetical protein
MPAAGRLVEIDASRLPGWIDRFAARHGSLEITALDGRTSVRLDAADGARAEIAVPYGGLPESAAEALVDQLVEHVCRPRTLGVLLVRRRGWAAGVVRAGALIAADTGGGHVQARTKAGGWSQQRFARRRGNQAQQVYDRAAEGAAAVLLPYRTELDALLTGGDRAGVAAVLGDPRLVPLARLAEPRLLAVPDPKPAVLAEVVGRLTSVAVTLNELA